MKDIQKQLLGFAKARDWEKFQSPKNLSMALSVETSELLEHFQWLTEEDSKNLLPDKKHEVALELADVTMYALLLASRLDIDLEKAIAAKLVINEERYPVAKVKGRAVKYTDL